MEEEEIQILPKTNLVASNNVIDKKINNVAPSEEFVPSTGRQLVGMGIEIGGGFLSELSAPLNLVPVVGTSAYLGVKYTMGVGSSYVAQFVEGQPEWRHGRAQFAGGANLVPFGSTVRKTKDGVQLFSKAMAGRATKSALKGSTISTAAITGERVIDDGRLPTLKELGFAATFGGVLGAGIDIGSVQVGEKFLPVWDRMSDGMKGTFLKVAGKSPVEIREQIAKGKISREEFRVLRDQLVDDAYKDAGFFDGFMGNKQIDVNSLEPQQRLDYVKNRTQYLDELEDDLMDNLDDGIVDAKEFKKQSRAINDERKALANRERELKDLQSEPTPVKPEAEQAMTEDTVVDETPEVTPKDTPEVDTPTAPKEAPATNKDAEYERLVKEDPEAAKQMLREEAEANGYDTEAFHGTHSEGIKEFAGGTHFGSKGAANKRNSDVRKNIEAERDNTLNSLSKQNPTISKYFDLENDADVQAIYQKYRDKYDELDTDGRGFGGESVDSKPVPKELIDIQNETDALILQKLKEGLKKQKDDLEILRQKALEDASTPKGKAKVNEVFDDTIKRDTEVSESLIKNYEEAINSLTRGSTVMPVFIKTGKIKRTVDVEGVDEMGNPVEGGSRSITDDFEEGVNTLQYTNKFEGDESFVIKDSEQAKSGELIVKDKDGNIIPLSQRFKGQETPATPKDAPEPTPAPSTKERILELAEELMGRKDILDADGNKIGLGDRVAVEKTEELTNLFKDYKNRVFKPVKEMVEGGDYDADEVIKVLDDYSEIAPAKFEVDNKDGSTLAVRREDRTADQFQKSISERKQTEVDDIVALRNMVKQDKEQPIDFDNLESLRKRVVGDTEPEVDPKSKDEGIDNTPTAKRVATLEKQLEREREIFTGQKDPNKPKTGSLPNARVKELQAKIKFYKTASKEASEVADLEEKNKLLLSMVSGQDVSKINETLGIHPKFRPDYANKTKVKSYLNVLRKQNQKLQKEARKVQLEQLQDQANRVINPELYGKSKLDRFIDKFDELSRGNLLASTLTGTAGVFSNTVAMLGRPIRDTLGGRLWRNLPIQEKRLHRQALYRLADLISYKEVVTGFLAPSNIRNMYGAAVNRGQNPMFPRARARYDETIKTPRFKNQRTVDRARANQQRRDKGDGLKNSLHRIKAAATVAQTLEEMVLFGQTMLGVIDVPFANAITKSRLRADAIRDAIRNEAKDINAHAKTYIDEAYEYQNGKKVWAYKDKYIDVINEYREALLMPRDLKEGDIRKTISETIVSKVDKETGSGRIFGRIIQLLFPIRTTGAIATGQIVSKVGALPINIGRLAHKGLAKISPDSRLVEGTGAGILAKTKNNVQRYKRVLRAGVDDKGNKLTDESRAKINEQLVVEETRLAKLSQQMEEIDRKAIGNLAMFGAFWLYFWNLTDEETYTGSGAHLTRQQRKDSNFQPYKMLFDDGDTMADYRMSDPDKAVIAFIADVKAWQKLSENNQLVEGQTLTKTMRQSAYQIITDNPFMTGYRNVGTAINPEAEDDRYLKAILSIATSRFQPPSMSRHINQFDDVYVPDHTQSKPLDMVTDRMFGNAPANVRRYETGAPMFLPEKNIWNFVGRFMPTKKVRMRFQEVYDILEADGQRTNIVGSLSPTQNKIKTKDYWNDNDQTLYDAFGDFIYKYSPTKAIQVGKKRYRNLTLEEAMYEIITDPDWDDKYQNGKISNTDVEGVMYADDFYDNQGNILDANEVTNQGLQELQDVRLAYIRAARDEFFKQETLEQFKNSDGLTPSMEAARISNIITE